MSSVLYAQGDDTLLILKVKNNARRRIRARCSLSSIMSRTIYLFLFPVSRAFLVTASNYENF